MKYLRREKGNSLTVSVLAGGEVMLEDSSSGRRDKIIMTLREFDALVQYVRKEAPGGITEPRR